MNWLYPCASNNDSYKPRRGLPPAAWLIYTAFWVIQPVYEKQLRSWLYLAVALVVFVPLFLWSQSCRQSLTLRRLCNLGMLLVALVYVPVNESAFGIYFYLSYNLQDIFESDRSVLIAGAAEVFLIWAQGQYFHLDSWEWMIGTGISSLSVINSLRMRQQEQANKKLGLAHEEIEQLAKTAERERIARDLHDLLGHTLSLIVIKSELAGKLFASDPVRAAHELGEIEATARRALAEVRETVTGYRSQGLSEELKNATRALEAAGVRPEVPQTSPRLPAQHEAALALVLREAVTNVVRHASAARCRVELLATGERSSLIIFDDGRGIGPGEGNGLRGMRERVVGLGGTLVVDGSRGTRLEVILPVL